MHPDAESPDSSLRPRANRVSRACDRCRIRKIKCNGTSQCKRCSVDDAICVYTKKRRPNDRAYSKEYVQLLEEQQTTLIKAVKEMYRRNRSGEALPDLPHGCDEHMLIHEVLKSLNVLPKKSEPVDVDEHHHADSPVASSACSPAYPQSFFSEPQPMPVLSTSPPSPSDATASPAIPSSSSSMTELEFEGFMSTFDNDQIQAMQSLMQNLHKPVDHGSFANLFSDPYTVGQDFLAAASATELFPLNAEEHFVNPRDTSFSIPYHMTHAYTT